MLYTNLEHIETAVEFAEVIGTNENVVVICGRMGPFCVPVYRNVEELGEKFTHVKFYDMEYDNPEFYFFHALPEVQNLEEMPFIVFYRSGVAVKSVAGMQSKTQLSEILTENFLSQVNI
jgi:thioredoxin 1